MSDNFFKALETYTPVENPQLLFRLYYDKKTGRPKEYSHIDLVGDYITVTPVEFALMDMHIIVKDGKIEKTQQISIGKLAPSETGVSVMREDITLISPDSGYHWETKEF